MVLMRCVIQGEVGVVRGHDSRARSGRGKVFLSRLALAWLVNASLLVSGLALAGPDVYAIPPAPNCYTHLFNLALETYGKRGPLLVYANSSRVPIARAFEKEGLFYRDIAEWFDQVDDKEFEAVLSARLKAELAGKSPAVLLRWLETYPSRYRAPGAPVSPSQWKAMTPVRRLGFLVGANNPFDYINLAGREALFYDGLLRFDTLLPSKACPAFVTIDDDQGSYELKSVRGETDRRAYFRQRDAVEIFLEGSVGHQHLVHAWPENADERAAMAPYYIELLDAGTWFLYWRQMMRSPNEASSILDHRFLGVYTRASLARLHRAVVAGDAKRFQNKFRMIGARGLPADSALTGQIQGMWLPDFEMRSGNKGIKRDFMEEMLEARLKSGDYRGLQDFRDYDFNPSAALSETLQPWMSASRIAILGDFQKIFPLMRYSGHPLAHNHGRSKILSPLLPWRQRLPLDYKAGVLERAQARYAEELFAIASEYLMLAHGVRGPPLGDLREETLAKLEWQIYLFAHRVRLDKDFENYLVPRYEDMLPPILVAPSGDMDVNDVDLGIEYTFRFPDSPTSRAVARAELQKTAQAFAEAMGGGKIEEMDDGGHGHGLSVRFQYTDPGGQVWRIEWDGIRRVYQNGRPVKPRGGHIEIPTPKMAMRDTGHIKRLYTAMSEIGRHPARAAGGAHVNMDLAPLFDLPNKVGAGKLKNLIALFESHRPMIQFLWQHPFRIRVALPFEVTENFTRRINSFRGDWDELAKLLYEERYFNPYITRKPAYSQLNITGLFSPFLPEDYKGTIDIKNPEVQWFPAFGDKPGDRIEFRLFDAIPDVYLAVLQVKYVRALMNVAFNAEEALRLEPVFAAEAIERWKEDPQAFIRAAQRHFKALGLDMRMFAPLVVDALRIQYAEPTSTALLEKFGDFLPLIEDATLRP